MHIVFGELAPKSLALQRPESTSLRTAPLIHAFFVAFRPIIFGLNAIGNAVVRALGIEPAQGHERVQSAEELMLAIDASGEAGLVDARAHQIVDRALTFTLLDANQVMTPRTELAAVPSDASLPEVLRLAATSGFTRFPVYDGNLDHIAGILDIRRLMAMLAQAAEQMNPVFTLADHLSATPVVPESMPAVDALELLQTSGAQVAIVVDEYGGTAGLISREDVIDAVIGTHGAAGGAAALGAPQPDGSFLLDGLTPLAELNGRFGLNLTADGLDVETLGGYVFARLGRPAALGDEITTRNGASLIVAALDGLRVARVRLRPPAVDDVA